MVFEMQGQEVSQESNSFLTQAVHNYCGRTEEWSQIER